MCCRALVQVVPRRPEALRLAEQLDPAAVGGISKEHAAAVEMAGEYSAARGHYQAGASRERNPFTIAMCLPLHTHVHSFNSYYMSHSGLERWAKLGWGKSAVLSLHVLVLCHAQARTREKRGG
jgi:hypothetical protein